MTGVDGIKLLAVIKAVDFKKAYNTFYGGKLLKILRPYGVPDMLVETIYRNNKAKVIPPVGDAEHFHITPGVLQGNI